jgi:hypothetical protein
MGVRGVPLRGDPRRETTSPTVLDLDLRQIVVTSSDAGRMKGAERKIGGSMKSVEERKIEEQQIRSGSAWRSTAALRSVAAWMRTDVGRHLASPSVWPARGHWRTSVARRRKLARATAGHIDLRCCLVPLHTWRIYTDLPM